jgi:biotin carboxyl carrier protein
MMARKRRPAVAAEPAPEPVGEVAGLGGMRLVVSPASGRLRHLPPMRFRAGEEWVTAGQALAVVESGTIATQVICPVEAALAGVLVRDGEPVAKGQPLVWLEVSGRPREERED